jgi:hypothetical protein
LPLHSRSAVEDVPLPGATHTAGARIAEATEEVLISQALGHKGVKEALSEQDWRVTEAFPQEVGEPR